MIAVYRTNYLNISAAGTEINIVAECDSAVESDRIFIGIDAIIQINCGSLESNAAVVKSGNSAIKCDRTCSSLNIYWI